jgi:hypothetical protein
MTLKFDGLIERWGEQRLLFVRQLPGFIVTGSSVRELRERTAGTLEAHLAWLVDRELIEALTGEADLKVLEELPALSTSLGPRFDADLAEPGESEIEGALTVGRAALSDLIDQFEALTDEEGAGRPEATLRHVARLDRIYAGHLGIVAVPTTHIDPIDDLVDAAGTFEEAVDAFVAGSGPELVVRGGEEWTLAKALRRRTAHLREHLIDIGP